MTTFSSSGFSGGTKASPAIALFPQGITSRAGHGFLTGATAQILNADSPEVIRIVNPASAINQNLPTTGVKAGRVFRLVVSGATETNYVALRSSGGNEIDRIGGVGFILVQALQDAPTSEDHWEVVDVQEQAAGSETFTFTGGASSGLVDFIFKRDKFITLVSWNDAVIASVLATGTMTAPSAIPSRFIRANTGSSSRWFTTAGVDNGTNGLNSILINTSNGSITVFRGVNGNFAGGTSSTGNYRGTVSI